MSDVIIDPGNGLQYFPEQNSPDFAYRFVRGAEIWACLLQYPNDIDLDETPAVFLSTDGGAVWVLQDSAGAPISNKFGPTTVTYDSRFNYIPPASKNFISLIYAENPTTPIYDWHVVDFVFASRTYGSPYGAFTVERATARQNNFSSRPDGSMIVVYSRDDAGGNPIGAFYRIFSSGSWSGEATLESGLSSAGNLAVDASGNAHIVTRAGNYYRIDATNTVVAGPISVHASVSPGNLTIVGNSLCLAYSDGTSLLLATGAPLSAPVWSSEAVASVAGISGEKLWVQQINGAYAFDVQFNGGGSDYTIDSKPFSASGLTYSWISADQQHIVQSVRAAGTWSAPAIIWTVSPAASDLLMLAARGSGALARYRPLFQN
jgi:hypothetical protein